MFTSLFSCLSLCYFSQCSQLLSSYWPSSLLFGKFFSGKLNPINLFPGTPWSSSLWPSPTLASTRAPPAPSREPRRRPSKYQVENTQTSRLKKTRKPFNRKWGKCKFSNKMYFTGFFSITHKTWKYKKNFNIFLCCNFCKKNVSVTWKKSRIDSKTTYK